MGHVLGPTCLYFNFRNPYGTDPNAVGQILTLALLLHDVYLDRTNAHNVAALLNDVVIAPQIQYFTVHTTFRTRNLDHDPAIPRAVPLLSPCPHENAVRQDESCISTHRVRVVRSDCG